MSYEECEASGQSERAMRELLWKRVDDEAVPLLRVPQSAWASRAAALNSLFKAYGSDLRHRHRLIVEEHWRNQVPGEKVLSTDCECPACLAYDVVKKCLQGHK